MATLEEITAEVTAEVEAAKPLNKSVDGVVSEFTEAIWSFQVVVPFTASQYCISNWSAIEP